VTASVGLSARHVGELVEEILPLTRHARVKSIEALPPRDLLVVLATPGGEVRRLRFSADPLASRFHLQIDPVERHRGPVGPFYRRARERLEGQAVLGLEQIEGDRIVRLVVGEGTAASASVVLELTGRNANLLLLDRDGTLLEILVVPPPGSAAAERLAPGQVHERPPGRGGGSSSPRLEDHLPAPPPRKGLAARAPLSWRVEARLGKDARERREQESRREFEQRVERRWVATQNLLRGLEERELVVREADRVRRDGELILAHRARLRRGLTEVTLSDSDDSGETERRIELDPRLSPQENAERLFARYKKLRRTAERLPEERALAQAQEEHLRSLLERARSADTDLALLEKEAIAAGLLRPKQEPRGSKKIGMRLPYIRFRGARGSEIRVGRNAKDNDALTFRFSHGNDLWFHAADSSGSHVVLTLPKGRDPDPEEILDSAHLAIHFSPLRGARKADVHVAPCKNVKKPRRTAAGLVNVSGGKIRSIRIEPARLSRLLDTRPRFEAGEDGKGSGPVVGPRNEG